MSYQNFVFYGSWREVLDGFAEDFGMDYAREALWNLMTCATAGDVDTTKKTILGFVNGCCMPNITAAQNRYAKAVENGKKGGRPKKIDDIQIALLKEQGHTNKEIADLLGCSVSSVEKANRKNRKNLEKEIDKDKDIDIDNELEKEKEDDTPLPSYDEMSFDFFGVPVKTGKT